MAYLRIRCPGSGPPWRVEEMALMARLYLATVRHFLTVLVASYNVCKKALTLPYHLITFGHSENEILRSALKGGRKDPFATHGI